MLGILAIIAPIFLLIALGFVALRRQWFAAEGLPALGGFVLRFSLPALLFNALSRRSLAEVVNFRYLAAYAAGSLVVLVLGLLWARRLQRQGASAAALSAMGMCCANSAFIGYPLALQVVGPQASVALALTFAVENLLMIPLCLALADSGAGDGSGGRGFLRAMGRTLAGLPRNPIIVAIALGLLCALWQWQLPAPLARSIDLLAGAAAAVSLFYVGGMLAGMHLRAAVADAAVVSLGKLVLHPLAVAAALWWVGPIEKPLVAAALLMAGAPMLGVYAIFGHRHGQQQACAARMLVATAASFVTLAALVALLAHLGWVGTIAARA